MRGTLLLFKFTICLSILAMAGGAFAEQQVPTILGGGNVCVEFTDNDVVGDLNSPTGGGPLSADPRQVLYTEPVDGRGGRWPFDSVDYGTSLQIDALACHGDAYFSWVITNRADLLVSFEGDEGVNREAVYIEKTNGVTGKIWDQKHLYAENDDPPPGSRIQDIDAIELYGPRSNGVNPKSGWDATCHSVINDLVNGGGTSVFYNDPPAPYIPHAQIVAAVVSLGFIGSPNDVDLDGLMCGDGGIRGVWDDGDKILFSIRAAGNWDGGELVVLPFGGPAAFLNHGGHLWNTAFNIQTAFDAQTEEIDAIEAAINWVPEKPRPDPPPSPHWNNPDIHNLGPNAYDITIVLEGKHTIIEHVDDDFQQFQTAWVDGNTVMRWSNHIPPSIPPCNEVHIGWATAGATKVVDGYWTDANSARIPGSYIYLVKPEMHRLRDGMFVVTFENVFNPNVETPDEPIVLTNIRYAVGPPWELEVLNGDNAELIASLEPLASELELYLGDSETLEIPEDVPYSDAVVLVYDIGASPHAEVTDYAEAVVAMPAPIPTVTEWGLIILALLLVTAGAIVIRQRLRVAA